jgi:Uma2 family endonuclease
MHELSPETIQVIHDAQEEARQMGHLYWGPESLFLALLRSPEVNQLFPPNALTIARQEVRMILGKGWNSSISHIQSTPKVQRILELSQGWAREFKGTVGPELILLTLLQEGDSFVNRLLYHLQRSPSQCQEQILARIGSAIKAEVESIASRFHRILGEWLEPYGIGRVWRPLAPFVLSTGDLIRADVLYCQRDNTPTPDLVVFILAHKNPLSLLRAKSQFLLATGIPVCLILDPEAKQVEIYSSDGAPLTLTETDILAIPTLFPGWTLPLQRFWHPDT